MPEQTTPPENYYATAPYKAAFDIGYPQENLEGQMYVYCCKHCKKLTTEINGRIENHAPDCAYRVQKLGL